jgi:prepilin-type processing-associated H-X9-DG protein
MNWHVRLLPHLEQEPLWRQAVEAHQIEPNPYAEVESLHPRDPLMLMFECPADPRAGSHWVSKAGHRYALTMYLGVLGTEYTRINGVLFVDSRIRLGDITDGTSNTLMVGERPPSPSLLWGWWYTGNGHGTAKGSGDAILGVREYNLGNDSPHCPVGPYAFGPGKLTNPCDVFHFWSLHSGGAHFVLADGSVRFIGYGAKDVMPALATRAGGETVEVPRV